MNDPELDVFEQDLKKLNPAPAPEELVSRLIAARPTAPVSERSTCAAQETWKVLRGQLFRVLAPGCAALVILVAVIMASRPGQTPGPITPRTTVTTGTGSPKTPPGAAEGEDQLEIDRYLVASFETVAESPEKGPVRLRFDQWLETVTFRDPETGIAVERHIPRLQVVPVRFESY